MERTWRSNNFKIYKYKWCKLCMRICISSHFIAGRSVLDAYLRRGNHHPYQHCIDSFSLSSYHLTEHQSSVSSCLNQHPHFREMRKIHFLNAYRSWPKEGSYSAHICQSLIWHLLFFNIISSYFTATNLFWKCFCILLESRLGCFSCTLFSQTNWLPKSFWTTFFFETSVF